MGQWQPERVWQSVRRRVREWMGVDDSPEAGSGENEEEADPSMLFHLSVTAPIVIALLILMRRAL